MWSLHQDLSSWHLNTSGDIWCWSTRNIFIVGSYRTQSQTNYVSKWEDNILKDIKSFTCPCTNWTTNEQETARASKAGKYSIIIIIIIIITITIKRPSWISKAVILLLYLWFPRCCRRFNPSSCHLLSFCLSYVTASRPYMSLVSIVP